MLDGTPPEIDYLTAGRFVHFLIETRGISQFIQLYQFNKTRSQATIRASFSTIYGESYESIEEEYLSGDRRCGFSLGFCDPDEAETVQSSWSVSLATSCLDPDFYGAVGEAGTITATQRVLKLTQTGQYRLRIAFTEQFLESDGSHGVSQVTLLRCGGCDEQRLLYLYTGEYYGVLESGLYTVIIAPAGESTVTLDIQLIDDAP